MTRIVLLCLLSAACMPGARPAVAPSHPGLVDDVPAALRLLEQERTEARLASGDPPARRILRLAELGLLDEADSILASAASRTADLVASEAELRYRQYRFAEARTLVDALLRQQPANRAARMLSIRLAIQAWQLEWAEEQARAFLARGRRDATAGVLLGRVFLLRKEYEDALAWAERVQGWSPGDAEAHLLEADVHFWMEQPAEAEAALRRALELDPLNADARFGYGYALWRRAAPALLSAMAGQWNLALAVDPLHQATHWHLGNGHTPLTYADYAGLADTLARAALAPVDTLISRGLLGDAVALTRALEPEYPQSVLPALWRGSAFYIFRDRPDIAALDSAQAAFQHILEVAPNFGPAHNGLAAVLKQRQFHALARYDSLEFALTHTPIAPIEGLYDVFPDLGYYPGDRTARMVTAELGPAIGFLPLLQRQGQRVLIPPLHRDLAAATGDPSFRTSRTFDNRQWMDIRGVGGSDIAAAGIEYLERGAHQERGVLLHEYMHLVHASVLTDAQVRRVRELYLGAMAEDRTLDYYAASNEQEFLSQAVEAYLSPEKVHPLNHKAMNTRGDLERKDPGTFAFVAALIDDLERYVAGDPGPMRSNWSQVYVNLSERARDDDALGQNQRFERAAALLDSALFRDAAYLPAMLSYAALERDRGRFASAADWLARAEAIDPEYSPILAARADLIGAGPADLPGAADTRAALLRRAAAMERDALVRAGHYRELWDLYIDLGRVPEAIATAQEYTAIGPTISTGLREAREESIIIASWLRSEAGYAEETLPFFREKVAASPLDFELKGRYTDVLALAGQRDQAMEVLEEASRILDLAGDLDPGISTRLAELRLAAGDTAGARSAIEALLRSGENADVRTAGRLVRVLVSLGQMTEAHRRLAELPEAREPGRRAEISFTRGWISEWRGDLEMAEMSYREAVAGNPYHRRARVRLYALLLGQGKGDEARQLADAARTLPLPLGPAFEAEIARTAERP